MDGGMGVEKKGLSLMGWNGWRSYGVWMGRFVNLMGV